MEERPCCGSGAAGSEQRGEETAAPNPRDIQKGQAEAQSALGLGEALPLETRAEPGPDSEAGKFNQVQDATFGTVGESEVQSAESNKRKTSVDKLGESEAIGGAGFAIDGYSAQSQKKNDPAGLEVGREKQPQGVDPSAATAKTNLGRVTTRNMFGQRETPGGTKQAQRGFGFNF